METIPTSVYAKTAQLLTHLSAALGSMETRDQHIIERLGRIEDNMLKKQHLHEKTLALIDRIHSLNR